MMVGFEGEDVTDELRDYVAQGVPCGVVLFRRNLTSTAQSASLLRDLRGLWPSDGPTPLMAVDQEGGRVQRLKPPHCPEIAPMPTAGLLAQEDDLERTRASGALAGRQLSSLGFNLDFAPVLDVDSNPGNPIIGDRAFGHDPDTVIRHALTWAQGLEGEGVLACGKHFPGHGDTDQDSHLTLPRLPHDLERLCRVELPPFEAAVQSGLGAIMSAHIVFEALDDRWPATLSERVLPALLRERLGYEGVVFSDDLEMAAIDAHHDARSIARQGLAAGIDVFLVCRRLDRAREIRTALAQAACSDRAVLERLERASERVSLLRARATDHAHGPFSGVAS